MYEKEKGRKGSRTFKGVGSEWHLIKLREEKVPGTDLPLAGSDGNDTLIVQAHSRTGAEPALQSTYQVEETTGPTRNGGPERGINRMLVGYMQLLTATAYHVTYNGTGFHHTMQGFTYVDTISKSTPEATTNFPWYDSGNFTSQGVPGEGLLTGAEYITGRRDIAMSDSPFPYFKLRDPRPNFNAKLDTATFSWDFELILAVGTLDAQLEGSRYPYFRRAVSSWNYQGVITDNGAGITDVALASPGVAITAAWVEEKNGTLVFDQNVVRDNNGVPITANVIINSADPWFLD